MGGQSIAFKAGGRKIFIWQTKMEPQLDFCEQERIARRKVAFRRECSSPLAAMNEVRWQATS